MGDIGPAQQHYEVLPLREPATREPTVPVAARPVEPVGTGARSETGPVRAPDRASR